jgi:thymidylate synthase ThyX
LTISSTVIADSVNRKNKKVRTLQLRYPRMVHADFMTHRQFSRNASSSRATPIKTLIQDVIDDPAYPVSWGSNKPGMQAGDEVSEEIRIDAYCTWIEARDDAVARAEILADMGLHKQIVNRILEPFAHINVIVTSSHWANFLALRNHPDADPTLQALAACIEESLDKSTPTVLEDGQYHLPYISQEEKTSFNKNDLVKMSVARCARVSYLTHDKKTPTYEQDIALYDRLVGSEPIHASPTEHQAIADSFGIYRASWGNLDGFVQFRKTLSNECITNYKGF